MIKDGSFLSGGYGGYLSPDSLEEESPLIEYEDGGVALSDPSQGISGYTWKLTYIPSTGTIMLKNTVTNVSTDFLTGIMDVVGASFAFDSNMRPAIGYQLSNGDSKLYYYNTVTESYSTLSFPAGTGCPRLCHDDKRAPMVGLNTTDILCFYISPDNILSYRQQRDRYAVEYPVATLAGSPTLKKVGMSVSLRLRVTIHGGQLVSLF